jgi:hypothetical protein
MLLVCVDISPVYQSGQVPQKYLHKAFHAAGGTHDLDMIFLINVKKENKDTERSSTTKYVELR